MGASFYRLIKLNSSPPLPWKIAHGISFFRLCVLPFLGYGYLQLLQAMGVIVLGSVEDRMLSLIIMLQHGIPIASATLVFVNALGGDEKFIAHAMITNYSQCILTTCILIFVTFLII
jgi:hypothetical protein